MVLRLWWLDLLTCVDSVKKRSSEGLEKVRMELEEREKVCDELHGVQLWMEAADVLLSEMEQSRSTEGLQVRRSSTKVTSSLLLIRSLLCKPSVGLESGRWFLWLNL